MCTDFSESQVASHNVLFPLTVPPHYLTVPNQQGDPP